MNSEMLKQIEETIQVKREKIELAEDKIISNGNLIEELLKHQGWVFLSGELKKIITTAQEQLDSPTICDTLAKIRARQYLIQSVTLLLKSPQKFLIEKQSMLNRRHNGRNKQ